MKYQLPLLTPLPSQRGKWGRFSFLLQTYQSVFDLCGFVLKLAGFIARKSKQHASAVTTTPERALVSFRPRCHVRLTCVTYIPLNIDVWIEHVHDKYVTCAWMHYIASSIHRSCGSFNFSMLFKIFSMMTISKWSQMYCIDCVNQLAGSTLSTVIHTE